MEKKNEILNFRQFLEKSVNLFAILGVCGAFMVVPIDLKNRIANYTVPLFFYVTFIMTCFEILVFCGETNDGSFKFDIFVFIFILFSIGMIAAFVSKFADATAVLLTVLYFTSAIGFPYWCYKKFVFPWLKKKHNGKKLKIFHFSFFVLIAILGVSISNLGLNKFIAISKRATHYIQCDTAQFKSNFRLESSPSK